VGRVRDNNEDAFNHAWLDDDSLYVQVADGMGGHEAGEVASSLAVRVVEDVVTRELDSDPRERLYHGLLEANEAILEEASESGTKGMGTTSVVAILKGSEVFIGLVGDSRCFHVRHGKLIWRTLDHTRVQMLVDQGELTDTEARNHPEAGMLTRALGHGRMADGRPLVPDVLAEPLYLEEGDTLVLSSDGLHDLVEDWEIAQTVAGKDADEAADVLVEMALERGGHDNTTVAVINAGPRAGNYDPHFVPEWPPTPVVEEAEITYSDFEEPNPEPAATMPPGAAPTFAQGAAPPVAMAAPEPAEQGNKKLVIYAAVGGAVLLLLLLILAIVGVVLGVVLT